MRHFRRQAIAGSASQYEAVTWSTPGAISALGQLPGGADSSAEGLNDNGAIVGTDRLASGFAVAVRWR
jgi:uncharacterized membrane protein